MLQRRLEAFQARCAAFDEELEAFLADLAFAPAAIAPPAAVAPAKLEAVAARESALLSHLDVYRSHGGAALQRETVSSAEGAFDTREATDAPEAKITYAASSSTSSRSGSASQASTTSSHAQAAAISHAIFLQRQLTAEIRDAPRGAAVPVVVAEISASVDPPEPSAPAVASAVEATLTTASVTQPADSGVSPVEADDATHWEAAAAEAIARGEWKEARDPRGRVYFMNKRERVTTWNLAKELRRRAQR
jgi:hypothetical protein